MKTRADFIPNTFLANLIILILMLNNGRLNAASEFAVTLHTDKTNYLVGEPIFLTGTIEYQGQTTVEVNNPLDPGSYKEVVEVALRGDGQFVRFTTRSEYIDSLKDRLALHRLRLEPGIKLVRRHTLLCWFRGTAPEGKTNILVFPTDGEYEIRFTVVFDAKRFSSVTRISVAEPVSETDKRAWAWLQQPNRLEKFCELDYLPAELTHEPSRKIREEMLKPFDELLRDYRDSVYATYIKRIAPERTPR